MTDLKFDRSRAIRINRRKLTRRGLLIELRQQRCELVFVNRTGAILIEILETAKGLR